jgi:hypothetical protein
MNTPIGRLSDHEWGWIVAATLFGWISTRAEQTIAEGRDAEATIRSTGIQPDPCDVAVVRSILPELAEAAKIDWEQPPMAWSKDIMIDFLMLAWQLINKAESARNDREIFRKSEFDEFNDPIPF